MFANPETITLLFRIGISLLIAANLARYRHKKAEFQEGHVTGFFDWLNRNPVEFIHFVIFFAVLAPGLLEGAVDLGLELLLEE